MGLNFHVRCKIHRVVGMIARGQESEVLHRFYSEHANCRKIDRNSVEVQADEASEQDWMYCPLPTGYTGLGLLCHESTDPKYKTVEVPREVSLAAVVDDWARQGWSAELALVSAGDGQQTQLFLKQTERTE